MTFSKLKQPTPRILLLGATLIAGAGGALAVARAQPTPPKPPSAAAEFHGTVAQYDLTPRGDVDGLILSDGTEVHFPPHLGRAVQAVAHPGDEVTVRGERSGTVVRAASVAGPTGSPVVDRGPGDADRPTTEVTGTVKMALHGPRGELNGALLEDGTVVRLPPGEATQRTALLQPGQAIAVRGEGTQVPAGRVIAARAIGSSLDKLTPVAAPAKPPHPPGPPARG